MQGMFYADIGLSDHTIGLEAAMMATALGACVIEKHLTLGRSGGGPDDGFASEPHEFKAMVQAVHNAHKALGDGSAPKVHDKYQQLRPSIYAIRDIEAGEPFTKQNIRIIRPGNGLPPERLPEVLQMMKALRFISRGTPLSDELLRVQSIK